MKKRVLSVVLAVCMLLSLAPFTYAQETVEGLDTQGKVVSLMTLVSDYMEKGKTKKALRVLRKATDPDSERYLNAEDKETTLSEAFGEGKAEEIVDVVEEAKEEVAEEVSSGEDSTAEETITEEPVAEEPIVEEPIAEEPTVEEPIAEEPIVEEPIAEEPIVEEPVVEEPIVEEPVVEEPIEEASDAEDPAAEETIPEEPAEEESPSVEELVEDVTEIVEQDPELAEELVEELKDLVVFDVQEAFETLLSLETDEAIEEFLSGLKEEDLLALGQYCIEMQEKQEEEQKEEEVPETVDVTEAAEPEWEEEQDGEAVALLLFQPAGVTDNDDLAKGYVTAAAKSNRTKATDGEEDSTTQRNVLNPKETETKGLYTDKVANKTSTTNVYELTMGAFVSGTIRQGGTQPVDVVLVLDQSGSMDDDFTTVKSESYDAVSESTTNYNLNHSSYDLYVQVGKGQYSELSIDWELDWFTVVYTYEWKDATGATQTAESRRRDGTCPDALKGKIYKHTVVTETVEKRDALKAAANQFISDLYEGSNEDYMHRVAVVGFASDDENWNSSYYENTELLSTSSVVNYQKATADNYKDALVNVKDSDAINTRLTTAIGRLDAYGATAIDCGMDMAKKIFDNCSNDANNDGKEEQRKKIVIVLTDGVPGSGDWDSYTVEGHSTAKRTLDTSEVLKGTDYNATVYSIGIFEGADATSEGKTSGTETEMTNYFLQHVSSNNGTVQTPSYYLSAGNADALKEIFQSISKKICVSDNDTLQADTMMKDIVSNYFDMPAYTSETDKLNLRIYKVPVYYKDGAYTYEPESTWDTTYKVQDAVEVKTSGTTDPEKKGRLTYYIDTENKTIEVLGFDYSANCCPKGTIEGHQGYMLVIRFDVVMRDGFWGGNEVPTNDAESGIYTKDEDEGTYDPVSPLPEPTVDIDVNPQFLITNANAYFYYGGDVIADDLVKATVQWLGADDYVDFEIPADQLARIQNTFSAAMDQSSYFYKDFEITVTPTVTTGSAKAKTVKIDLTVYVFRPKVSVTGADKADALAGTEFSLSEQCLKDETVTWECQYTGSDSKPHLLTLQNNEVWESIDSAAATNTGKGMTNTEPEMKSKVYTYAYADSAKAKGTLSGEKFTPAVDSTVTSVDFNVSSMSFTLQAETDTAGTYKKDMTLSKGERLTVTPCLGDGHDFTVYVKFQTGDLTIEKEGLKPGESALFEVRDSNGSNVYMTIAIVGDDDGKGKVTISGLAAADYRVYEVNDWSWKYTAQEYQSATVVVEENETNKVAKVSFSNSYGDNAWKYLNDEDSEQNRFKINGGT